MHSSMERVHYREEKSTLADWRGGTKDEKERLDWMGGGVNNHSKNV